MAKRDFMDGLVQRARILRMAIVAKLPAKEKIKHEITPMVQQVYKEYQREAMPEYAVFKKE